MSLEDLYREIILDHYRNPRNRGELPSPPSVRMEGFNPLCGDEVVLYVLVDEESGRIADIRVGGQGCSISQSSASMMTQAVKGCTPDEARRLIHRFKAMMSIHEHQLDGESAGAATEGADGGDDDGVGERAGSTGDLGELEALRGVVRFPVRIKCATLSWNALSQALDEAGSPALSDR